MPQQLIIFYSFDVSHTLAQWKNIDDSKKKKRKRIYRKTKDKRRTTKRKLREKNKYENMKNCTTSFFNRFGTRLLNFYYDFIMLSLMLTDSRIHTHWQRMFSKSLKKDITLIKAINFQKGSFL